jgi:hypothetical protein
MVRNAVSGALVRLQLARAYAMSAQVAKARAEYEDFLTSWKEADPEIPILRQAKREYAKLLMVPVSSGWPSGRNRTFSPIRKSSIAACDRISPRKPQTGHDLMIRLD